MISPFDLSPLWSGLRPSRRRDKSKTPRSANPGRNPLKIRGELSKQPGPALTVHFGTLLSQAASPLQELGRIIPTLSKKRMIEFGRSINLDNVDFGKIVSDDMMSMEVISRQLDKPVDVLDLSDWQINVLQSNGFGKVRSVLSAGEKMLQARIRGVGEVRSRQMVNAAKSAILEYLLG